MKSIVILISGRGSNMQAIVEASLPIRISAVITNRADARGLQYAAERDIDTAVVDHMLFPTREAFDALLAKKIDEYQPDFVLLAGFMRVLTWGFVDKFHGRLINIHPSLLPAFTGLHTHERALEAGVTLHGCSVHFVTPALDHGPIIIQAAVPVLPSDDAASLAARVLRQEHIVYPLALRWLIEGKVSLGAGQRVRFNGAAADGAALISPREQE
ncbi:MAG: phosphoribosylglycinamide formyltransferase [Pseudomonadota bacterium]|nr:phosphoribosylglycinamide formyltransferase [Pseudomonadota bacterium]